MPARRARGPRCGGWSLTASGGPFRGRRRDELTEVTPEQALAHPTWNMGPVVTINSATLVNKGLEVIEAHELFGVPYDDIEVDGAPAVGDPLDGRVRRRLDDRAGQPAGHAAADRARPGLAGPGARRGRRRSTGPAPHTWEFGPLDDEAFPAVRLAKEAGRAGRCRPAIYNAANEECVAAFTAGRLPFLGIVDTVERVLAEAPDFAEPGTVDDVLAAEAWARARASDVIAAMS